MDNTGPIAPTPAEGEAPSDWVADFKRQVDEVRTAAGEWAVRYQRTKAYRSHVEEFTHIRLPLHCPEPHAAPTLEPQPEVRPTVTAPVFRRLERFRF